MPPFPAETRPACAARDREIVGSAPARLTGFLTYAVATATPLRVNDCRSATSRDWHLTCKTRRSGQRESFHALFAYIRTADPFSIRDGHRGRACDDLRDARQLPDRVHRRHRWRKPGSRQLLARP